VDNPPRPWRKSLRRFEELLPRQCRAARPDTPVGASKSVSGTPLRPLPTGLLEISRKFFRTTTRIVDHPTGGIPRT
jgi:hypothetical protein